MEDDTFHHTKAGLRLMQEGAEAAWEGIQGAILCILVGLLMPVCISLELYRAAKRRLRKESLTPRQIDAGK